MAIRKPNTFTPAFLDAVKNVVHTVHDVTRERFTQMCKAEGVSDADLAETVDDMLGGALAKGVLGILHPGMDIQVLAVPEGTQTKVIELIRGADGQPTPVCSDPDCEACKEKRAEADKAHRAMMN